MMLLVLVAATSIGVFLLAFWMFRIVAVARNAIAIVNTVASGMRNPDIDDLAREKAIQKAGIDLVFSAGSLIARSVIALAAAGVPIWIADLTGLVPVSATLAFMERWDVVVISSLLIILGYIAIIRLWPR